MIVVSASLKKSGSGWYFNLTNDLLVQTGHPDVRALRTAHGLEGVLRGENCQLNPRLRNLWPLMRLHRAGHTFTVKTHVGPTLGLRLLERVGAVRVTYIFRDPRDVVLSALDHAASLRDRAVPNVLANLRTVEDAARYVKSLLSDWHAWKRMPNVLMVRYEDLVADTVGELERLAAFLGVSLAPDAMHQLASRYTAVQLDGTDRHRLHFNRGIVNRYQEAMSPGDRAVCERLLAPYLRAMDYPTS